MTSKHKHTLEIAFLVMVIALSLVGFSSLSHEELTAYHYLHIFTSLSWLLLLLGQLVLIRQHRFHLHRTVGLAIFVAGPVLVASLALLSVHSAAKDAVAGRADVLVVQNVMFTLEVALLVFLAFILRQNRNIHGSLLMSTVLMFMVIALFFTLIAYVPQYRIEGPETFSRFGDAAQASALVGGVVGLLFFLRNWRNGWPWILTSFFVFLDGYLQMIVAQADRTTSLTVVVASVGRAPAFGLALVGFLALLGLAWKVAPGKRRTS